MNDHGSSSGYRRTHRHGLGFHLWNRIQDSLDWLTVEIATTGVVWSPVGFITPGAGLAEIRATLEEDAAARRCVREIERYLDDVSQSPPEA